MLSLMLLFESEPSVAQYWSWIWMNKRLVFFHHPVVLVGDQSSGNSIVWGVSISGVCPCLEPTVFPGSDLIPSSLRRYPANLISFLTKSHFSRFRVTVATLNFFSTAPSLVLCSICVFPRTSMPSMIEIWPSTPSNISFIFFW